jgi:hypothetical protein
MARESYNDDGPQSPWVPRAAGRRLEDVEARYPGFGGKTRTPRDGTGSAGNSYIGRAAQPRRALTLAMADGEKVHEDAERLTQT